MSESGNSNTHYSSESSCSNSSSSRHQYNNCSSSSSESLVNTSQNTSQKFSVSIEKEDTKKEQKVNFKEIKDKLIVIEAAVTKGFNTEEKSTFIKLFRNIIVDNEQEVIAFPTATFFITKFEQLDSSVINDNFKEKILTNLHLKQYQEKQNNSKLKYW